MDAGSEIEYDMPGVLRWHKSGRVERFDGTETVPPVPSGDPANSVASKDVVLDPGANLAARLYLPAADPGKKLPIVVFFHGGEFFLHTAASPLYHTYAAAASPSGIKQGAAAAVNRDEMRGSQQKKSRGEDGPVADSWARPNRRRTRADVRGRVRPDAKEAHIWTRDASSADVLSVWVAPLGLVF